VLNTAGVEDSGSNVRISWSRVQKPLANRQGQWFLAKVVSDGPACVFDAHHADVAKHRAIASGLKADVELLFPPVAVADPMEAPF
jgi:hypothetical protein